MTKWKSSFILLCLGALVSPAPASAFGNIYQDAIPHIKACISLIQEREALHTATDPVDLRAVCPTLVDFLSYEPISEIDPPLENYTQRAYLESLLALLEAAKQVKAPALPDKLTALSQQPSLFASEPTQKPFFLALAQWTFSQLQTFLIEHTKFTQPRYLQTFYIVIVNLIIIMSIAVIVLYSVMAIRNSPPYVRHFKIKWQRQLPAETPPTLDEIAQLKLDLQIPALIALIKHELQQAGMIRDTHNISNAQLLHIATQARPAHDRDISRLIRLYDRLNYSQKTVAADEVSLALEQVRDYLAEKASA